jgi:hypothetical protein
MLEGFWGNYFWRRLQGTQISPCRDFFGVEYMKKGKYISGDERSKLMFLFPTWG